MPLRGNGGGTRRARGGRDVSDSDYSFDSIIIRQLLEVDSHQYTSMSCSSRIIIFPPRNARADVDAPSGAKS